VVSDILLGFDRSFEFEKVAILHANVIYYTLCRFQKLSLPNTSETILLDFFEGWIIQPFSHLFARIIHIIKYLRTYIHSKQLKTVVFSLVILIPLVLFALGQLSAIDQNFASLTTSLFKIKERLKEVFCRFIQNTLHTPWHPKGWH